MTTFTISTDNNITAFERPEDAQDTLALGALAFASQKELLKMAAAWPSGRLAEIWNGFAGVAPFGDLKPVKKFTDRKTAVTRIWQAIQKLATPAPEAAQDAPDAAKATTTAIPASDAPKPKKGVKSAKPKATKTGKSTTGARESSKKAIVLELLRRKGGATMAEIREATDWQKHYADFRIMPTCVGNPACGAGIAAMESA
jgi:hypothetical protein